MGRSSACSHRPAAPRNRHQCCRPRRGLFCSMTKGWPQRLLPAFSPSVRAMASMPPPGEGHHPAGMGLLGQEAAGAWARAAGRWPRPGRRPARPASSPFRHHGFVSLWVVAGAAGIRWPRVRGQRGHVIFMNGNRAGPAAAGAARRWMTRRRCCSWRIRPPRARCSSSGHRAAGLASRPFAGLDFIGLGWEGLGDVHIHTNQKQHGLLLEGVRKRGRVAHQATVGVVGAISTCTGAWPWRARSKRVELRKRHLDAKAGAVGQLQCKVGDGHLLLHDVVHQRLRAKQLAAVVLMCLA